MKEPSKDRPAERTKEDVFEQVRTIVLSGRYAEVRSLVDLLAGKARVLQYVEKGL